MHIFYEYIWKSVYYFACWHTCVPSHGYGGHVICYKQLIGRTDCYYYSGVTAEINIGPTVSIWLLSTPECCCRGDGCSIAWCSYAVMLKEIVTILILTIQSSLNRKPGFLLAVIIASTTTGNWCLLHSLLIAILQFTYACVEVKVKVVSASA